MNLAFLPANVAFLDAVAERWLALGTAPGEGLILLPTRRAARALAEAFLRVSNGQPLLLPRITALGALDEAPLVLAGALDLPPAVEPALRLAELTRLILLLPQADGGVAGADQAWKLAGELAGLMDEAERAEIADLPTALAGAADGTLAQHWEVTLRFLEIVTRQWPLWLRDNGLMNPAARQVALLRAQARAWQDAAPDMPIWIAGTTGGIKAVARLLKVVAGLPRGQVILPGLDTNLPAECEPSHAQAGLQELLLGMGATPDDVAPWLGAPAAPDSRVTLLATALLPAAHLQAWRAAPQGDLTGLYRLEPADQQEEAVAIALILRGALEQSEARAALVTPDRQLATRVAAELLRWGVVADDSAGEPLAHTPPAVFLRLLAQVAETGLAPVPLLALLKHPLAAAGLPMAECRTLARDMERQFLRGPKPPSGLGGLRHAVSGSADIDAFLTRIEHCLAPMLRLFAPVDAAPIPVPVQDLLAALVQSAEALAATDDAPGPARLWAHEEGVALAEMLAGGLEAMARLPDQSPGVLPGLLDVLLDGAVVRSRRALRGRELTREHPRVFIWGLLEARLQAVDVVVLGGLAEGVWPQATDPGPWLSRPMRTQVGLPSPEEIVGQSAHDFVMAACSAPVAVLSCPRRRDGAPAVPARWLARIEALLGPDRTLPRHPAAGWARLLDHPRGAPLPVRPPQPCPPVRLRPRKLSVTEIDTWTLDPYAIHARHILRLRRLDPLEQATDAADYGKIVHRGFQLFLAENGIGWSGASRRVLRIAMDRALAEARLRPALVEWWRPRLLRIADWAADQEIERRNDHAPVAIGAELPGRWELSLPESAVGNFVLTCRADRIERRDDGVLAILDYKTGQPPSQAAIEAGIAVQLPLEAAMADAGAFGVDWRGQAAELTYWHVTGGFEPGKARSLFKGDAAIIAESATGSEARLRARILAFDEPDRAYLAQPHSGRRPRFSDYAQLARVDEWDAGGEPGDEP